MIKISHEFPENYYLEGLTEDLVDYQYCLAHRFQSNPGYRYYFYKYKYQGGEVYLDNSLYELGSAFSGSEYLEIIVLYHQMFLIVLNRNFLNLFLSLIFF